jgi:hypothetical protein
MLFARGAGIRKKRVDEVPATAVAPLVAELLGITLSNSSDELQRRSSDSRRSGLVD